ncbi:DUF1565 domain-containing protein [bacterium]|nr:DUF1565 domain-containing protein [bacterium]
MLRNVRILLVVSISVLFTFMVACGSNDSNNDPTDPVDPTGVEIQVDVSEVDVGGEVILTAIYTSTREDLPDCVWYVDDVPGGDAELGLIPQDNPTTYTAPGIVPAGGSVEISVITSDEFEFDDYTDITVNGPIGVELEFSAMECQVATTVEVTASIEWSGRDTEDFDWYVDDVLNGVPSTGTITQTNPAVYTAPSFPPPGGDVEIKAVLQSNADLEASDLVDVLFTIKYVDAVNGDDTGGGGSWDYPFRTISFALDEVEQGDTLLVAPGTYDEAHGETDEWYRLIEDITLRGSGRDEVLIYGHVDQYCVFSMYEGSTIENVTIGDAGILAGGELTDYGIYSSSTITIRNVTINDYFEDAAIWLYTDDNYSLVENCELVQTVVGEPYPTAIELTEDCHAIIRACTVTGWALGIWANTASDPLIEYCTFTNNGTAISLFSGSGDPAPETNPDLGGGHRASAGNNVIQDNEYHGIYCRNQTGTIYALFNTWNSDPPTTGEEEGTDFYSIYDTNWVWH